MKLKQPIKGGAHAITVLTREVRADAACRQDAFRRLGLIERSKL